MSYIQPLDYNSKMGPLLSGQMQVSRSPSWVRSLYLWQRPSFHNLEFFWSCCNISFSTLQKKFQVRSFNCQIQLRVAWSVCWFSQGTAFWAGGVSTQVRDSVESTKHRHTMGASRRQWPASRQETCCVATNCLLPFLSVSHFGGMRRVRFRWLSEYCHHRGVSAFCWVSCWCDAFFCCHGDRKMKARPVRRRIDFRQQAPSPARSHCPLRQCLLFHPRGCFDSLHRHPPLSLLSQH